MYPYLKINILQNGVDVGKFVNVENEYVELQVILQTSSSTFSILNPIDSKLSIKVLDTNVNFRATDGFGILIPVREGSCQIGIYYTLSNGNTIYLKEELVVYESFFKDNYLTYFVGEYDKKLISENKLLKIVLDTCMEFFDIYFAYVHDIDGINNPYDIKSKFLQNLAITMGFDKIEFLSEGNSLEYKIDKIYRELLGNLLSLIQLRGTKLSYELFFGSLGYDVELLEFWYDGDGNLVEINNDDESASTFKRYTVFGVPYDVVSTIDPRLNVSYKNDYNINQKSNYILPIIETKDTNNPFQYSGKQKLLINNFLEYLQPGHIEYLLNIIKINIFSYVEDADYDTIDYMFRTPVLYHDISSLKPQYGYGEICAPGTWKTPGLTFAYPMFYDDKINSVNVGIPDYFIFSELRTASNSIMEGENFETDEDDPYANPDIEYDTVTSDEEIAATNEIVLEDFNKYDEEDYSDDQDALVVETSPDSIIYDDDDITLGSKFGTIGSSFAKKVVADDNDLYYEDDDNSVIITTETETNASGTTESGSSTSTETNESEESSSESSGYGLKSNYTQPIVYANEPPCNINHNDGRLYYGTWPWETNPRGNFIERVWGLVDNKTINPFAGISYSTSYEIEDILQSLWKYDTKNSDGTYTYKYDQDLPQGIPVNKPDAVAGQTLFYDDGIIFNISIRTMNVSGFLSAYYVLKSQMENDDNLDESWLIDSICTQFNISETDYLNLKPIEIT